MFNKEKNKINLLSIIVFVAGMFCVSIANVFGGFYCSVVVIEAIAATMLVYTTLDKKEGLRENIVNLSLVSIILFFGLLFFLVNDVFGISVYSKGDLGFWGICVLISQTLSILLF